MANVIINDTNLINIADAIRSKNGLTDKYKPSEMATAILAIEAGEGSGGGFAIPEGNYISIYGDSFNSSGNWDWLLGQGIPLTIEMSAVYLSGLMDESDLKDLSHLTFIMTGKVSNLKSAFQGCDNLKYLPNLLFTNSNTAITNITQTFMSCDSIQNLPEDLWLLKNSDGTAIGNNTVFSTAKDVDTGFVFTLCYSLRNIPKWRYSTDVFTGFYNANQMFLECLALDEIVDFPANSHSSLTSNKFSQTFDRCCHLKRLTFQTQADGTPYAPIWNYQTINLSECVGHGDTALHSGHWQEYSCLPLDAEATPDNIISIMSQYPDDWWTQDVTCSRYNLDSALETISTLPNVSACYGNTIIFKAEAGSTYGKRIGDMTEEEIAVATAKGWTVSMV